LPWFKLDLQFSKREHAFETDNARQSISIGDPIPPDKQHGNPAALQKSSPESDDKLKF
jgi:hypothetical protein